MSHKKLSVFATPGRHTFLVPVNRGFEVSLYFVLYSPADSSIKLVEPAGFGSLHVLPSRVAIVNGFCFSF